MAGFINVMEKKKTLLCRSLLVDDLNELLQVPMPRGDIPGKYSATKFSIKEKQSEAGKGETLRDLSACL